MMRLGAAQPRPAPPLDVSLHPPLLLILPPSPLPPAPKMGLRGCERATDLASQNLVDGGRKNRNTIPTRGCVARAALR